VIGDDDRPSVFLYGTKPCVPSRATHKTCRHKVMIEDDDRPSLFLYDTKPCASSRATHKTCRHKAMIGDDPLCTVEGDT
jgi:hypothetical protein